MSALTCALDFSRYQGLVNFAAIAAALRKLSSDPWCYVKASQGTTETDPEFVRNLNGIKASGIGAGAYHYYDEVSAVDQAHHFASVLRSANFDVDTDVAVLDLERAKSQAIANADAITFASTLRGEFPGIVLGIYMGMTYAGSGTGAGLSKHYDFWIVAHYTHTTTWPTTFSPELEHGNTTGWPAPHVWQCSQSMHVAGISGAVDADVSLLGFHQLLALGAPQMANLPCLIQTGKTVYMTDLMSIRDVTAHAAAMQDWLKRVGLPSTITLVDTPSAFGPLIPAPDVVAPIVAALGPAVQAAIKDATVTVSVNVAGGTPTPS